VLIIPGELMTPHLALAGAEAPAGLRTRSQDRGGPRH